MQVRSKQILPIALIISLLAAVGVIAFRANRSQAPAAPVIAARISESELESQYGLHINLLAVTGAGGFVDLRIKIVDGEKAKQILSEKKNFPALLAGDDRVLNAPEDTKSQEILFEDGAMMFIMYPNSGNAVVRGAPVNVLFGDLALDPIAAR
jgi:hypothetical protein